MDINKDYQLIPMDKITPEARGIAVMWYDGVCDLNDIRQKHKLASVIMNYASLVTKEKDTRIADLEKKLDLEHNDFLEKKYLLEASINKCVEYECKIADLEAKLAQAIEFQKRAFSYGKNGCSWEEFFTAQEKEAQESEKGGL